VPLKLTLVVALCLLGEAGNAQGRPSLDVAPQFGVFGGVDTNAYLDAAVLPTTLGNAEVGGPLLAFSPSLSLAWRVAQGHSLLFTHGGRISQFLGGALDRETTARHGGALAYLPPKLWGFQVWVQGGFEHFLFRHYTVGWTQGFGRFRVTRPLAYGLGVSLAYVMGYVSYDAEDDDASAASSVRDEWTHGFEASLAYQPWSWLHGEASYALARTLATPRSTLDEQTGQVVVPPSDAFDGWRHGISLRFEITPRLPVALDLGYHLWLVDFDHRSGPKQTPQPGPPPTMPTQSLLHELSARVAWHVLDTVDVQVRYAAFFGATAYWGPSQDPGVGPIESTSSTQRHQVLAGLVFHRSLRRRTPTKTYPLASPAKRLVLRLRIPGAKSVAVLGTFNGWSREEGRLRRERGGLWVGSFALPPGDHRYTLWIDGTLRPPKNCSTLIPDGFGSRNCAIVIAEER